MALARPSTDTRERILDAAEALFAERGFDGTSMRQITAAATCNLAAVNYHFGSKDTLIHEVFHRRLTVLNRERLAMLEAAEAEARSAPLKPSHIVEAFFGPSLRMAADTLGGGATFMRLLGRTYTEPSAFVRTFLAEEYSAVIERFMAQLYRALPGVPRDEILWRFHFMLGATSYALAGTDALRVLTGRMLGEEPEALGPRLMSFLLGGLRAPLPQAQTVKPRSNGKTKTVRRAA